MPDPANGAADAAATLFEDMRRKRQATLDAHEEMRRSPGFVAAAKRTEKLVLDFGLALNALSLMSTRHDGFKRALISIGMQDLLLESAVAAMALTREGLLNAARREMRFLLEASIKAWWCDNVEPTGDVARKVDFLDDLGAVRFREVIESIAPRMMDPDTVSCLTPAVTNLYAKLSTHVHASSSRVAVDLNRFRHGKFIGFETTGDVNRVNDLFQSVLDIALAAAMESFHSGLVGDVFVGLLDDYRGWAFHKTPFCRSVSAHFDYKAERRQTAQVRPLRP
jgi:hypothetical protein